MELDLLTGAHTILRADLVQDVGKSLNPAIDIGQCEGAFIQGVGWLTLEDLLWDKKGRMDINYDIPMVSLFLYRCAMQHDTLQISSRRRKIFRESSTYHSWQMYTIRTRYTAPKE